MALRAKVRALPVADTAAMVEEFAGRATPEDREALAESFAMLSWEEVRELSRVPGAEIGAHTYSHCNLAVEPPESRRRELETCRDMIAVHLGKPPRLFAYPFGKRDFTSAATRQSVIDAGFDCAITTERGLVRRGSDPYFLPRAGNFSSAWMLAGELLYFFARERRRRPRAS